MVSYILQKENRMVANQSSIQFLKCLITASTIIYKTGTLDKKITINYRTTLWISRHPLIIKANL